MSRQYRPNPPPAWRRFTVPSHARPLIVLAALVVAATLFDALGLFDRRAALDWARGHHAGWPTAVVIIAVQIVMFAFALPGSAVVWVAAALYPVPAATMILTAGGTAGALAAYLLAHRLTAATAAAEHGRLYRLLQSQGDFLTLCALRVLPGMPHSVISYAAGLLHLALPGFLAAAALGFALKGFLYSSAIVGVLESEEVADLLDAATVGPLVAIALLLLVGRAVRRRWQRSKE